MQAQVVCQRINRPIHFSVSFAFANAKQRIARTRPQTAARLFRVENAWPAQRSSGPMHT